MAITYTSQQGTRVTSAARAGTLTSSSASANEILMSGTLANNNNGQIGTKYTGYVGRIIAWRPSGETGTYESRLCTAETGTTTVTLTLNEPYSGTPASGDDFLVYYDIDDIETGGAGGGVSLNSRTGLYEFSRGIDLSGGVNTGYLAINSGVGMEMPDGRTISSTTLATPTQFIVGVPSGESRGAVQSIDDCSQKDYRGSGISGGVVTTIETGTDTPLTSSASAFYGSVFWSQLDNVEAYTGTTASQRIILRDSKWLGLSGGTIGTAVPLNSKRSEFISYDATGIHRIDALSVDLCPIRYFEENTFSKGSLNIFPGVDQVSPNLDETFFIYKCRAVDCTVTFVQRSNGSAVYLVDCEGFDDYTFSVETGTNETEYYFASAITILVQDTTATPLSDASAKVLSAFQTSGGLSDEITIFTPSMPNAGNNAQIIDGWKTQADGIIDSLYPTKRARNTENILYTNNKLRVELYGKVSFFTDLSGPLAQLLTLEDDSAIVESSVTTAASFFDSNVTGSLTIGAQDETWLVEVSSPSSTTLVATDTVTDGSSQVWTVEEVTLSDTTILLLTASSNPAGPSGGYYTAPSGTLTKTGWSATVSTTQAVLALNGGGTASIQNIYDGIAAKNDGRAGTGTTNTDFLRICGSTLAHPLKKEGAQWSAPFAEWPTDGGGTGITQAPDPASYALYAYNTTDNSATAWLSVGGITWPQTFTLNAKGLLGNSEIRIYENPSLLSGGGSSVEVAGVETVAAVTQVGNGINGVTYGTNGVNIVVALVGQTTSATELVAGNKFRVLVRNNADNPTLQLFDEFEVSSISSGEIITTTSDVGFTSVFGTVLNSNNFKTVTIEKVNATESFSLSGGTYDITVQRIASLPITQLGFTVNADSDLTFTQRGDRVYNNPV